MTLHQLAEALRHLGMDVDESESEEDVSVFRHVTRMTGLLCCAQKKYRRLMFAFWVYRDADYWYVWYPHPKIFRIKTAEEVIELGRRMFSRRRRAGPSRAGTTARDILAEDVTDSFCFPVR